MDWQNELSEETKKAVEGMPEAARKEIQAEFEKMVKAAAAPTKAAAPAAPAAAEPAAPAAAETPAADDASATPKTPPAKLDLAAQMELLSAEAGDVVAANDAKSQELGNKIVRQRRKSRDLEQEVFGMHLTDLAKNREIFDEIDEDKSGSIDRNELGVALKKTGKNPDDYQKGLADVISHYGVEKKGESITFDEFLKMLKEWDDEGGARALIAKGKAA